MTIINILFRNSEVPQTGLSPVIDIYEVGGSIVVTDGAMTEYASIGWYYYDFTTYDQNKKYIWVADGTVTLGTATERYRQGELSYFGDV